MPQDSLLDRINQANKVPGLPGTPGALPAPATAAPMPGSSLLDRINSASLPSTTDGFSAPAGGSLLERINTAAPPQQDQEQEDTTSFPAFQNPDRFAKAWNQGTSLPGKLWNVAMDVPTVDFHNLIKNWGLGEPDEGTALGRAGRELENVFSGQTSVGNLALILGTWGSSALLESGGAAALKGAGFAAEEIPQITKGLEFVAKARKIGAPVGQALAEAEKAGINSKRVVDAMEKLSELGMTSRSVLDSNIARRLGSSMLRPVLGAVKAEQVGTGLQYLMSAGFTAQAAYGTVMQSPRLLDTLQAAEKEQDPEKRAALYRDASALAVDVATGAAFTGLGGHEFFKEAGEAIHDAGAAAGLHVKPSEENLYLMNQAGVFDRKRVEGERAAFLWADQLRKAEDVVKKYPQLKQAEVRDLLKNKDELERLLYAHEAGLDEELANYRRRFLAKAAGIPLDANGDVAGDPLSVANQPGVIAHLGNDELARAAHQEIAPGTDFIDLDSKTQAKIQKRADELVEVRNRLNFRSDDQMIETHGRADKLRTAAFVLPDGRLVNQGGSEHRYMIGSPEPTTDNLEKYLNTNGTVRVRYNRTRAGDEVHFSIPLAGVSEDQARMIRSAVGEFKYGTIVMEKASQTSPGYKIFSPATVREVNDALKQDFGGIRPDKPGSFAAFSPNVYEKLTLDQAQRRMSSKTHLLAKQASDQIKARVGLGGETRHAIGGWDTGVENSLYHEESSGNYNPDAVEFHAILMGKLLHQKTVLVGHFGEGPDRFRTFHTEETNPEIIRNELLAAGVQNHTILPSAGSGHDIAIFDEGDKLPEEFNQAFAKLKGSDPHVEQARGEFIGDWNDREKAQDVFRGRLEQLTDRNPRWRGLAEEADQKGRIFGDVHRAVQADQLAASQDRVLSRAPRRGPPGSTVDLQDHPLDVGEKPTTVDVAQALQNFTTKTNRLDPLAIASADGGRLTPRERGVRVARAVRIGEGELRRQLSEENSGGDWYEQAVDRYIGEMQKIHPELSEPDLRGFYNFVTAVASLGNDSFGTIRAADELYQHFKDAGEMPSSWLWGGQHTNANASVMRTLQEILDRNHGDPREGFRWLMEKHLVRDLNEVRKAAGKEQKVNGKQTDLQYGALALGKKIGPFGLNLNGVSDMLTMDKWATRTWNRWMGTLVDGENVHEAPRNAAERSLAQESFQKLADQFGLSLRQAQAALWYYEQHLYKTHGIDIDGGVSYGDAAEQYVGRKLGNVQPEAVADRGRAAAGGGEAATDRGVHEGAGEDQAGVPAEAAEGEAGDVSFDPQGFAMARRAPGLYSKALQVAEEKLSNAGTGEQILKTLKNNGVKDDEIKWTGLDDFLKDKPKATKQEVTDFLKQNQVQVDETILDNNKSGSGLPHDHPDVRVALKTLNDLLLKDDFGGYDTLAEARQGVYQAVQGREGNDWSPETLEAARQFMKLRGYETLPPRWADSSNVTPGGENHREIVLSTPGIEPFATNDRNHYGDIEGGRAIAWVRASDFTDTDGKKTLMLDEIQSKRHQMGRKEGYSKDTKGWTAELLSKPDAGFTHWQIKDANGNDVAEIVGGTSDSAIRTAAEGIPDAPFKNTWHELAMKRMLRYAAENGYDKVAWTTGEQQAERYDLSKKISKVTYNRNGGLQAFNHAGTIVVAERHIGEDKIADYVGKEAAEKLLAGENRERLDAGIHAKLEGLDLKVGGEGMKGFYDKILPDFVNKYAKKWGAKVGTTNIEGPSRDAWIVKGKDGQNVPYRDESGASIYFPTHDSAIEAARESGGTWSHTLRSNDEVHAVDVTPEMKKGVMEEGQPLFARKPMPVGLTQRGVKIGTAWASETPKPITPESVVKKFGPEAGELINARMRQMAGAAAKAVFMYQPREEGGAPGYMAVDDTVASLLNMMLKENNAWSGVTIMPKNVPVLLERLERLATNFSQYDPAGGARLMELHSKIASALQEHPEGGVAMVSIARGDASAMNEERIHVLQAELGNGQITLHADLGSLAEDPTMEPFVDNLTRIGYNPNHPQGLVLEAAAHIMAGDRYGVGGTVEQRAAFLTKYLRAVAEQNGVDSLGKFESLLDDHAKTVFDSLVPKLRAEEMVNAQLERLGTERPGAGQEESVASRQGVPAGRQDPAGAGAGGAGGAEEDRGGAGAGVVQSRGDRTGYMKPDDLLRRTETDPTKLTDNERAVVQQLAEKVRKGETLEPVRVTLDKDGQVVGAEGQLRAIAMQQAGVERVPVEIHHLGSPDEEINYLFSRSAKGKPSPPINPEKAERAMDEARLEELAKEGHFKNKYTPAEARRMLDLYDPRKWTEAHKILAKEIGDQFSKNLENAQANGVLNEGLEHYVTHMWAKDENNGAVNRLLHQARSDRFAINTPMARQRMLMSSFEGQMLGKKLAVTDPVALAAHNGATFNRVIAARQMLDNLRTAGTRASDGRPMVAISGSGRMIDEDGKNPAILVNPNTRRSIVIANKVIAGLQQNGQLDKLIKDGTIDKLGVDKNQKPMYAWSTSDYNSIPHPAMQDWNYLLNDSKGAPVLMKGDLRVHPEAHEYLNRFLGQDKSPMQQIGLGRGLLRAGREAKSLMLAWSPFHLAQEGLRAVMTGISPFGIEKWDLRTDPALAKLVEHGLTLGRDRTGVQDYMEGVASSHGTLATKLPGMGKLQSWLEEFLFDKYIPGLKARAARDVFARYKQAYPEWTNNKVAEVAAADINERFGGINYRRIGRSAMAQDIFRVAALAPDWLESEVRFMARTFGQEGKVARADMLKMSIGLWATARVLNYVVSGAPHNEAPFGVAYKGDDGREKIFSIRTMPTDMLHAVSDPGGFLKGRVSPLGRTFVQAYTARDDYGRKLPDHQLLFRLAENTTPIVMQSAVKAVTGQMRPDTTTPEQAAKAAGLTVRPYRTEAQNTASEIASDHSEQGPVDQAALRRHQAKMKFEDDIRSGQATLQDLNRAVEEGHFSPKEAKDIHQAIQKTHGMDPDLARLYTRASRLAAPDLLKVWDVATSDEKAALSQLLIQSRNRYYKKVMNDLTPQERQQDPTYLRLRRMFPQEPVF